MVVELGGQLVEDGREWRTAEGKDGGGERKVAEGEAWHKGREAHLGEKLVEDAGTSQGRVQVTVARGAPLVRWLLRPGSRLQVGLKDLGHLRHPPTPHPAPDRHDMRG